VRLQIKIHQLVTKIVATIFVRHSPVPVPIVARTHRIVDLHGFFSDKFVPKGVFVLIHVVQRIQFLVAGEHFALRKIISRKRKYNFLGIKARERRVFLSKSIASEQENEQTKKMCAERLV
jgi:hypothetical protein